jgi:hypothetical protein
LSDDSRQTARVVNLTVAIDGKMKGDSLKVTVPEVIGNVLNGLEKNRT